MSIIEVRDLHYGYEKKNEVLSGANLSTEKVSSPSETMWVASKATVPVALMRTSWNYKQGMSLAIKGGTAQGSARNG